MKAKVTSEIKHQTAKGTDMVIRFVDAHNRAYFEAEIPSMFPGARGVSRSKLRDRITGKSVDCLTGTFAGPNGQNEPFGIALTPDLLKWHDENMSAWEAEQKASRAAELKIWYANRHTWNHDYWIVDSRLSDDEIIAGLPESVLDAATEKGFREELAEARQKHAAKDAAKTNRDTKLQASREEAKRTGKPVEIASFMAECDGSVDGCSTDYVVRSVWPDGSIREERTHTY